MKKNPIKDFFVKGDQNETGFQRFIKKDGFKSFISSVICVVLGLLLGFLVILIVNAKHSGEAMTNILLGGFNAPKWQKGLGQEILFAAPLLICSLSIIFAYKCGLFNIGCPGQYVVGMMFSFVAAYVLKAPWYVCILFAAVGGALWGMIPGLFKAFLNVNEVITSIMFNWIGLYLTNYIVGPDGPFADKMYNTLLAECYSVPSKARLPQWGLNKLFGGNKYITIGIFIALILVVIVSIILNKTKFGYEIKATGHNKDASKYAGMTYRKNIIITMAISGALAGIASATLYLTNYEIYSPLKMTSVPPMGFNGIAVAFLGALSPVGSIFASLLISHITIGGSYLDTTYYSKEIGDLIAAIIIYLCSFSFFIKYLMENFKAKKEAKKEKEKKKLELKNINNEKAGEN